MAQDDPSIDAWARRVDGTVIARLLDCSIDVDMAMWYRRSLLEGIRVNSLADVLQSKVKWFRVVAGLVVVQGAIGK